MTSPTSSDVDGKLTTQEPQLLSVFSASYPLCARKYSPSTLAAADTNATLSNAKKSTMLRATSSVQIQAREMSTLATTVINIL